MHRICTGEADAHIWPDFGVSGAISAISYELNLVFEDFEGTEENNSKETLKLLSIEY